MSTHQPGKRALCAKYSTHTKTFPSPPEIGTFPIYLGYSKHTYIIAPELHQAWVETVNFFLCFFMNHILHLTSLWWIQTLYLFFFKISFFCRDKSCLNLTLPLNTHRYQLPPNVPGCYVSIADEKLRVYFFSSWRIFLF